MKKRGFTLIELLVVIAIIGLLSSVVLASLGTAREKSRDARRLSDVKQLQLALELYYDSNGQYPARNEAETGTQSCGGDSAWCNLMSDLDPYLSADLADPLGSQTNNKYYYDADSGDNYRSYGFMVEFENSGNFDLVNDDGGYYNGNDCCYYEVGPQPSYCYNKYSSSNRNWWSGGSSSVCRGGN